MARIDWEIEVTGDEGSLDLRGPLQAQAEDDGEDVDEASGARTHMIETGTGAVRPVASPREGLGEG